MPVTEDLSECATIFPVSPLLEPRLDPSIIDSVSVRLWRDAFRDGLTRSSSISEETVLCIATGRGRSTSSLSNTAGELSSRDFGASISEEVSVVRALLAAGSQ
jgi:hypothetical protein